MFGTEQHFGIELIKGSIAQKTWYLLKSSNFIIQYAIVNNPNFNQNNEKWTMKIKTSLAFVYFSYSQKNTLRGVANFSSFRLCLRIQNAVSIPFAAQTWGKFFGQIKAIIRGEKPKVDEDDEHPQELQWNEHQQRRTYWWTMLEHQTRPSPKKLRNFHGFFIQDKVKSTRIKGGYI